MLPTIVEEIARQILFLTEEEAQVFLDKHFPGHRVEVEASGDANILGPDFNFRVTSNGVEGN